LFWLACLGLNSQSKCRKHKNTRRLFKKNEIGPLGRESWNTKKQVRKNSKDEGKEKFNYEKNGKGVVKSKR